jgi:tripartite ATP-independent transporter DctM subunit
MIGIILFVLFAMFAIGLPISYAIALSTIVYVLLNPDAISGLALVQRTLVGADSFIFLAVPCFILAGELMNEGGVTKRLIAFAKSLIGSIRGGLAYVVVVVNMIMAGVSGSSVADAAAVGTIMIPTMIQQGYSKRFACAVNAVAGTIGPIIPPSIGFVIYAGITGVSVGKLFLAGAIPGVIMGLLLMVVCYIEARRKDLPRSEKSSLRELVQNFKQSIFALLMPVIILGGILSGIVTPTEAAVVAVVYGFLVGKFIYKELDLSKLLQVLASSAKQSARMVLIVCFASAFGWMLTFEGVPEIIVNFFSLIADKPWIFLLLINIALLILGCFMEVTSIIIIVTPLLIPVLNKLGIDMVYFGVVMMLNLMIGQLTPPVGMLLFVICGIGQIPMQELVRGSLPFLLALLVALVLITFMPQLSLFLPGLIM